MKHIYLETTIAGYLTSRPSRDLVIAARQELTREWWEDRRDCYELFVSQVVLDEASDGDIEAARRRLAVLENLELLETTESAVIIAENYSMKGPSPKRLRMTLFILPSRQLTAWIFC